MQFGFGEVEPVDKRNSIASARVDFLMRIREKAPEVLSDLAYIPYQMYIASPVSPVELWPLNERKVRLYALSGRNINGLYIALLAWAHRWNLYADWCLENACWTLHLWGESSKCLENYDWNLKGAGWIKLGDEALAHLTVPSGLPKWDAEYQFRFSYINGVKKRLKQHIEQDSFLSSLSSKLKRDIIDAKMAEVETYCDRVLEVYDSQVDSLGRPIWKRAESKADLLRNMVWTVKFQVQGKSYSEIANTDKFSPSTVKREVESTLDLIGLSRRPDVKRGRKLGSKDSQDSWRQSVKRAGLLS